MSNLTCMNNYMAMNIEELRERCVLLEHQNAELTAEVEWFMEQFKLAKHRQFGASSERTDFSEQQPSLVQRSRRRIFPWTGRTGFRGHHLQSPKEERAPRGDAERTS